MEEGWEETGARGREVMQRNESREERRRCSVGEDEREL